MPYSTYVLSGSMDIAVSDPQHLAQDTQALAAIRGALATMTGVPNSAVVLSVVGVSVRRRLSDAAASVIIQYEISVVSETSQSAEVIGGAVASLSGDDVSQAVVTALASPEAGAYQATVVVQPPIVTSLAGGSSTSSADMATLQIASVEEASPREVLPPAEAQGVMSSTAMTVLVASSAGVLVVTLAGCAAVIKRRYVNSWPWSVDAKVDANTTSAPQASQVPLREHIQIDIDDDDDGPFCETSETKQAAARAPDKLGDSLNLGGGSSTNAAFDIGQEFCANELVLVSSHPFVAAGGTINTAYTGGKTPPLLQDVVLRPSGLYRSTSYITSSSTQHKLQRSGLEDGVEFEPIIMASGAGVGGWLAAPPQASASSTSTAPPPQASAGMHMRAIARPRSESMADDFEAREEEMLKWALKRATVLPRDKSLEDTVGWTMGHPRPDSSRACEVRWPDSHQSPDGSRVRQKQESE